MKKSLSLLMGTALLVSLTACGGGSSSQPATTAAAAPAAAEAEITFKYAELNPDDNINSRVGYKFAEEVEARSNGRIKIDVYTASQLGDEVTCLNSLQMGGGTVDMYRGNTNSLSDYGFKKLNLFGLPYIFVSRDTMWKVLDSAEIGQAFLDEGIEVGAGMVGIAYTDEGARNTFTSGEITCLADLKGKKIRVPETTLMMDTMSAIGAEPTPISYSELYSSIQTGVVDGGENGYPGYYSNKFYEVAPYYLLDQHTFSPGIILMAEAKWNQLSAEDQALLREAGKAASEWNKTQIEAEEKELRDKLAAENIVIIDVPAEDKAVAQESCKAVWASYAEGIEDVLDAVVAIQQ
ncbi:MAG: TRAP transporter substrate-binding protein [Eubacteriales bacterium]|nr:TRAP transporter substrate-binding protein [Eubacteriales bacterium]